MMTDAITFERDGREYTAVVEQDRPAHVREDALVVESDGGRYAIFMFAGGYTARPIEESAR